MKRSFRKIRYEPGEPISLDEINERRTAHQAWRKEMQKRVKEFPLISVITPTVKLDKLDDIIHNYEIQVYPNKELIICVPESVVTPELKEICENNDIELMVSKKANLGRELNNGIEQSNGEWISKFDDDDIYFGNFLLDLYLYAIEQDVSIVGKDTNFIQNIDTGELYVHRLASSRKRYPVIRGGTITFKKEVWEKVKFREISLGEDVNFIGDAEKSGYIAYLADDMFNYVYRRKPDGKGHTWKKILIDLLDNSRACGKDITVANA